MIFQTVIRFILIISQTVTLQETKTDFLSHDTMNQAFSGVSHFYHSVFDFSQINCLVIDELVILSKSLNFFQRTGGEEGGRRNNYIKLEKRNKFD